MWFCPNCNHKIYEEFFPLKNIETDLPKVFDRFHSSLQHRTCTQCGTIHPLPQPATPEA